MIYAKIYNKNNELERVVAGTIHDGSFYVKQSLLAKLLHKDQEIIPNVDYAATIREGSRKYINLIYDGFSYKQFTPTSTATDNTGTDKIQRYITAQELAASYREPLLKKSNNIMLYSMILWLIFLGITAVIFENTITSGMASIKTATNTIITPYTSQVAQNTYLIHELQNETSKLMQLTNATLAKLNAP